MKKIVICGAGFAIGYGLGSIDLDTAFPFICLVVTGLVTAGIIDYYKVPKK